MDYLEPKFDGLGCILIPITHCPVMLHFYLYIPVDILVCIFQWQHLVYRHRTKTNKTNNIDTVATLGIQTQDEDKQNK
jgi:hypothetical protein